MDQTVGYFSAGGSSAVAIKLAIDQIQRVMYTHIDDQHPDSMRFVKDCEQWFGKEVEIWQSPFKSVDSVCRYNSFIRSRQTGAVCTKHLKRTVRKQFEYENEGNLRIVWGLDFDEKDRASDIVSNMPNHEHLFPLIDREMTKEHAHAVLAASGIRRPAMYDLGYHNNNCIGCVKGGMGYWNKIRVDFPTPGSPERSMTEPGTIPHDSSLPPKTLSNSKKPVEILRKFEVLTSEILSGAADVPKSMILAFFEIF